jgi:hypothetical protein
VSEPRASDPSMSRIRHGKLVRKGQQPDIQPLNGCFMPSRSAPVDAWPRTCVGARLPLDALTGADATYCYRTVKVIVTDARRAFAPCSGALPSPFAGIEWVRPCARR